VVREPHPRIPGLEGALAAFAESQRQRSELLASATSFSGSLGALAAQLPTAAFRHNLTIDLPKLVPSAAIGADVVRGLQVLDVSRIRKEQLAPVRSLTASLQQTMELYAGIAEQLQRPARLVQEWAEQHQQLLEAMAASVARFHEEQERRAVNARVFAERHGWPLLSSCSSTPDSFGLSRWRMPRGER
jgi:hypothetical protein